MEFKDYLKGLRLCYRYSGQGLAIRLGISRSTITKYESGERLPSIKNLAKYAKLFNLDVNDLVDLEMDEMRK